MPLQDAQGIDYTLNQSFCDILRAARMRKEKSIEEVAKSLCLDPATVIAIESCDLSGLPEPIYVRGYIRNYARLVGVDSEPMIQAYDDLIKRKDIGKVVITEISVVKGIRKNAIPPKVLWTVLAVLVIAIGLVVWEPWKSNQADVAETVAEPEIKPEIQIPVPPAESETPAQGNTDASPVEAPAQEEMPLASTGVSDDSAQQPVEIASHLGVELTLSASVDSWVEVRDATDKRVVYDLLKAGRTRTVRGVAPFNVLLGYASGIHIEYNGEPFDHSRFIRHETARFSLGQSTDNHLELGN